MPPATKSHPPAEFSLVSFVRSLSKDAVLRPGEGRQEADAVARAGQELAQHSGAVLRGHVLPITRAEAGGMSTGTLAGGGALVGSGLTVAAALQPTLQLERMGANRVSLDYGDELVSVPAIAGGGWVTEDGEIDCSEVLFAAAMRNPKEAAARLKISRRLFKQSGISEAEFRSLLQRTISGTVEAGLLVGSGTEGQPLGMLRDPQLQQESFTSSTGLPSRERVAELVAGILVNGGDLEAVKILLSAADYESSQYMADPTAGTSTLVEITNGQRRLAGVPVAFSPYVPTGRLVIADWGRVSISYIGNPQLVVNPYTYSESGILELTTFQMVSYGVERRELLTVATKEA
jgi:HK97 family phage major capsid protein